MNYLVFFIILQESSAITAIPLSPWTTSHRKAIYCSVRKCRAAEFGLSVYFVNNVPVRGKVCLTVPQPSLFLS
jgi:hypothetical protein